MSLNLNNKIVFITGASSGIGRASAHEFAQQGAHLILTARRFGRIETLAKELTAKFGVKTLPLPLDITQKEQVISTIQNLPKDWQDIDILLNNAGAALELAKMQEGKLENWDAMIDINVRGLLYVTHTILPTMVTKNSGHIINIGSIAGYQCYPMGNIYCATKHAVKAISQSLRLDLLGKKIRVSEISPGAVHTEFSEVRFRDKKRADDFYNDFQPLVAEDIADAVVYCATRPLHVDVAELVIFPTAQASVNHIYRE